MIERLRASKQRQMEAMGDVGAVAGKKWAEEEAEFVDLKAVAESDLDDHDADDISWDAIPQLIRSRRQARRRGFLGRNTWRALAR